MIQYCKECGSLLRVNTNAHAPQVFKLQEVSGIQKLFRVMHLRSMRIWDLNIPSYHVFYHAIQYVYFELISETSLFYTAYQNIIKPFV